MWNFLNDESKKTQGATPMVMIGHTKDFYNDNNLRKFCKKVQQNKIGFTTIQKFYEDYIESY
jgi:hypothetical protein